MKKTILITGMNNAQCERDGCINRARLKVINCHYGLLRCLEDMGYEVEQRSVTPGEDVSKYDHVIVYLHNPQGFAQRLFDGLWVIDQRPDAILTFDDWQVNAIWNGLQQYGATLKDNPDSAFRDHILYQYATLKDRNEIKKYKSSYLNAISTLNDRVNRVLFCAYKGGDPDKYGLDFDHKLIYRYNPNPYHLNRSWENNYGNEEGGLAGFFDGPEEPCPADKTKAWIFSSLVQNKTRAWLNKFDFDWELKIYGAARGEFKTERVGEDQMVKIYQAHWGNLMPSYDNIGSGWWRTRILQCAEARSITVTDYEEGIIYGEEFANFTVKDIEQMDTKQLWNKAQAQRQCLLDNHPLDKKIQQEELKAVLSGCAA